MDKLNYSLEVVVSNRPVREYLHQGKVFIEARKDYSFTLKFRNNTSFRVLAAFVIDGANVLNGKSGGETDAGYIVNAYDSINIKGFRVSDSEVKAFKFTDITDSYVNQVGVANENKTNYNKSTENCGVVAVRVWSEQLPISWVYNNLNTIWNYQLFDNTYYTSNITSNTISDNIISCCNVSAPEFKLGTAMGETVYDPVKEVEFQKSLLYTDLEIFYTTKEELIKYGVDMSSVKKAVFPQAFGNKYCKLPGVD